MRWLLYSTPDDEFVATSIPGYGDPSEMARSIVPPNATWSVHVGARDRVLAHSEPRPPWIRRKPSRLWSPTKRTAE